MYGDFFGTNLTGDDKVYLGHNNATGCFVELHFTDNLGKNHILQRFKDKYDNKKNFLKLDAKNASQDNVTAYCGSKKLFLSIVSSNYFISRLPSEQKNLLDIYLPDVNLALIYDSLENSEKKYLEFCPKNIIEYIKELNESKKVYEDKIKNLDGKISYATEITLLQLESPKQFLKHEELSLKLQELSFLKSNQQINNIKKQSQIVDSLNLKIADCQNSISDLNQKINKANEEYLALKNFKAFCCPTCGQPLTIKSQLVTIKSLKLNLEEMSLSKIKLEQDLQKLKRDLLIEKSNLCTIQNLSAVNAPKRINELEQQVRELQQEKSEIEQHNATILAKKNSIKKAYSDIQKFKNEIECLYNNLDRLKKTKEIAQKLFLNYIEVRMSFANKYLHKVKLKYYTVLKDSGEIKQDFIITYNGNELKNLSRSELIATSVEISNMLNKITHVNLPLFIDDSESCADYDFFEDFKDSNQLLIAKVQKNTTLNIQKYTPENFQERKAA